MPPITAFSHIPANSILTEGFVPSHTDSYCLVCHVEENIDKLAADFFTLPPVVGVLMKMRDTLIKPFGLKTGKELAAEYKEKGIEQFFPVLARTEDELVMGEKDKHLDFRVSVMADRENSKLYITTVVHYNNKLGVLYFNTIKPFHKAIVRSGLKRLAAKQAKEKKTEVPNI